jgi:RNA polymerase sigma factor (sigma-70 family)
LSESPPPFIDFVEEHRVSVHRFLTAAVGPSDADDCFQETFLAALRAYPRLGRSDRLDRWILKIASRKAIDHHRARSRRPVPTEELPDHPEPPRDDLVETDDLLWAAVRSLPPRQRVAVVHRHVLDRSYDEIAELMDTTPEAVRANVYQAMRRLRERFE